ncbi:hypothetical protein [Candidatus Vondammii sp. HM_W22]|nr:hypothetical protein [Candidatus Vondammii sp. HM_W22]
MAALTDAQIQGGVGDAPTPITDSRLLLRVLPKVPVSPWVPLNAE